LIRTQIDTQLEIDKAEAEVERLNNILENVTESRDIMIEDRNLLDQELAASKAEVARLRELLASSIAINKKWVPRNYTDYRKVEDVEQEARLALMPEEAVVVNPEPSSSVVDQKPDNVSDKNEWRELGPDEVIQEGDEVFSLGMWIPVSPNLVIPINDKRKPEVRFRTRRLLPKQEEERLLKVMEYCRKWADEHLAGHGKETFYARLGLLVDFATDLYRDEIETLKKNQK
jgi:hypothetical protein